MQKITKKDISLALSWARGEYYVIDIAKKKKMKKGGNVYSFLSRALKEYVLQRDEQDDELKHPSEDSRIDER